HPAVYAYISISIYISIYITLRHGRADRRRHDARRARNRWTRPAGPQGGLRARRLAAAARDGDDRRQPAPGDPLLVLAPQVPVPAPRRRSLPRTRRPT